MFPLYFALLSTCPQKWHNELLNNIHIPGQISYWGILSQLHYKYQFCVSRSSLCYRTGSHFSCPSKSRLYFSDEWGNCDGKQVFDLAEKKILKRFCRSEANSNLKWTYLAVKITSLRIKWTFCSVIPLNQKQSTRRKYSQRVWAWWANYWVKLFSPHYPMWQTVIRVVWSKNQGGLLFSCICLSSEICLGVVQTLCSE